MVVDIDGNEISKLTAENLEWLEVYNSLTDDVKMATSFTPDLAKPFNAV